MGERDAVRRGGEAGVGGGGFPARGGGAVRGQRCVFIIRPWYSFR